ncbi:MAG TPA: hypothetical protein VN636_18820 [Acidimicrobiia bacterium]|nr:hypothetical protein [Acidimicrobiia bacterium]
MNETRWVNPHQPQPLYAATILCYIEAVFLLLNLAVVTFLGLFAVVGMAAGGFGIANEKKWGYTLAVIAAVIQALLYLIIGFGALTNIFVIMSLIFAVALVALLLHPMSRDYQRIWFR